MLFFITLVNRNNFFTKMNSKNIVKDSKKDKKPLPKKKIIIAVILITGSFLGSFLLYFFLQIGLNTKIPVVVVVSGSMTPNINKGDLLFVKGTEPSNIMTGTIEDQTGDVIVFDALGLWPLAPSEPIVHRVVDKYQIGDTWYFSTKGDANLSVDPVDVPEDRIFGVVVGIIPFIGWVKIVLADSGLLIPLLIIISAALIISIVWDIIKGEDKDQKNIDIQNEKNHNEQ